MSFVSPEHQVPADLADLTKGVIAKRLPRNLFLVNTEQGREITASLSKDAQRLSVRMIPGEPVTIRLSKFNPSRGQIVERS